DTVAMASRPTPPSRSIVTRTKWRRPTRDTVTCSRSKPSARVTGSITSTKRARRALARAIGYSSWVGLHTPAHRWATPAAVASVTRRVEHDPPGAPSPARMVFTEPVVPRRWSRRKLLRAGAGTLTTALLTGCSWVHRDPPPPAPDPLDPLLWSTHELVR